MKKSLQLRSVILLALCIFNFIFCIHVPIVIAQAQDEEIKESETEINVKNAEIASIIRIFSKKTKRNYILDERVKGKVSIYLPGKVSNEESLRVLESVLMLKGFTSVPVGENLWKIVPTKDAKQSTIPTVGDETEDAPTPALVTRLIQVKNVNAQDIQQLIQPLVSSDGLINSYGGTNSLILIDSEENIRRLEGLISTIDIASSDSDMTLIPIKNADAKEIADKLGDLLGTSGGESKGSETPELLRNRMGVTQTNFSGNTAPLPGNVNSIPQMQNTTASGESINARSRAPKILADERTNSIIVVADEETTARVKALITQLDSKIDKSGNRFYVYKCQHAKAEDLAEVLSGLAGGSTGGGKASLNTSDSVSNESSQLTGGRNSRRGGSNSSGSSSRGGSSFGGENSGSGRTLGQSRLGKNNRGGVQSASIGENITVTADPSTNTLIIFAGKTDYEKMIELLKQLDIKRRQVIVEATLLEVLMENSVDLGVDFLSSGGGKDGGFFTQRNTGSQNLTTLLSNPQGLTEFSAAVASSGTLTLPGGIKIPSQALLVTAAQASRNANVLSAPQILTTDNEQAEIVVGQNVPFLTGTGTDNTNLNNQFNQIERQDVGITLRLTPQISSENFVTLNLFTEVSSVFANSNLGPTTNVRTSETTVIAKDGQMIVTGGLLSDDATESDSGVPFMKDIPVLGQLFKDSTEQRSKRNLLIFITPRIVQDQFDLRDSTKEDTLKIGKQIQETDSYPSRKDVLKNEKIDAVSETEDFTSNGPPIIPQPNDQNVKSNKQPIASSSEGTKPGVIQLKVSPKLSAETKTNDEKAKFFILKTESSGNEDLPFTVSDKGEVIITAPDSSLSLLQEFFVPGKQVRYRLGEKEFTFRVADAYFENQGLENQRLAYELSPYEILNLGKAPWN